MGASYVANSYKTSTEADADKLAEDAKYSLSGEARFSYSDNSGSAIDGYRQSRLRVRLYGTARINDDWSLRGMLEADKYFLNNNHAKIDNVAYNSYNDISGINPNNDSAYAITTVGSILNDREHLYNFPVPEEAVPQNLRPEAGEDYLKKDGGVLSSMSKRYIGFKWVNEGDRIIGFSEPSVRRFDMTGLIHTKRPVVFFTFDDWGSDASINQLLYVLRKHKAHGHTLLIGL